MTTPRTQQSEQEAGTGGWTPRKKRKHEKPTDAPTVPELMAAK